MMKLRPSLLGAVIALLVLACGASLTDAEWVWCSGNTNKVTGAARNLGIATNPGWWSRCQEAEDSGPVTGDAVTQVMIGSRDYYTCVSADAEFIAACRAVELADGGPAVSGAVLGAAEIRFCEKAPQWTETRAQSVSLGQHWFPSTTGTPSWVMRNVAVENLRSDSDFARACQAAFKARRG
jgi:hypothetical protein